MFFRYLSSISALASAIVAPQAAAQNRPVELASTTQVVRVVQDGGERLEELQPAVGVVPGDKLVFATNYRNRGAEPVTNLVIVNPVPTGVRLAEGDAEVLTISVDEGAHWGRLTDFTVPGGDGEPRPATIDDVTHIRWTIASLAGGQAGRASYSAIVR